MSCCLGKSYTKAFILLAEERGHQHEGDRADPKPIGGPGHHQAGDGQMGPEEAGEREADPDTSHGHRDAGQEDHVDVLTIHS